MFDEYGDEELLKTFREINSNQYADAIKKETARLMELEFIRRALEFIDGGGLNPH